MKSLSYSSSRVDTEPSPKSYLFKWDFPTPVGSRSLVVDLAALQIEGQLTLHSLSHSLTILCLVNSSCMIKQECEGVLFPNRVEIWTIDISCEEFVIGAMKKFQVATYTHMSLLL